MKLEQIICDFAKHNNLLVGICNAERLTHLDDVAVSIPFCGAEFEERVNPGMVMSSAKSIIVVGENHNRPRREISDDYGSISPSATGEDYHKTLGRHLQKLVQVLATKTSFNYKIQVDTGPLLEREFAKKAGIGWQGKNCCIISQKFGSRIFLGLMLTDLALEKTAAYAFDYNECGDCDLCIKACPTNALGDAFMLDYSKCVSYLTQKKGELTQQEAKAIGANLYGCDICQDVCPKNANKPYADAADTDANLQNILNLTNKTFEKKYKNLTMGWIGKKTLQRNAKIALENKQGR